ncbi:MAG: bi-domain-containing oxidoreductase [Pyrinomonadaceae bacterium]|nr:bi-domain-containing oxidoreductase [Pyrinomonadaceae bacterium]
MKQAVRRGLKEIIVEEVAEPKPSPHHVLVRPFYSLISAGTETADIHTDSLVKEVAENPSHVSKVLGIMMKTDPMGTYKEVRAKFSELAALGYAGAGIVIEKHPTVTDLEIGARVAYGGEGTGHAETIITGRNLVARVPDNVNFEDACFTTLGSIAMNAVRIANIGLGETVAVIGLGLVGQLVAQLARCQGGVVVAIDLMKERVEIAKNTGADFAVSGDAALAEIKSLTDGKGADCVIVAAAAKSAAPMKQAALMCRDKGRIVVVGACPLDLPRDQMYIKEIQLLMARAYGPGSYDASYEKQGRDYPLPYVRWTENRNMTEFLRLLSTNQINVKPFVSHTFTLDEAPKAYDVILDAEVKSLAVLLKYPINDESDPIANYKPLRRIDLNPANVAIKSDTLKFGLVGAGNLAKWAHLPAIQKIDGAELRGVYSGSGVRGKSYALRFKADYTTTDFDELINDTNIDVVLISSKNHEHADQVVKTLETGKHVFVEKPMATTIEECQAIYRAVQKSGKSLTVGFNRRFAPFYVELKKQLSKRSAPAVLNLRINSPGMTAGFWGADPKFGGAIVGEGCHFIDLMYWLLESEPISVSAYGLPTGKDEPIGENNIAATFKFADNSIANFVYCTVGSATSSGERVEVYAAGVGASSEDFKKMHIKKAKAFSRANVFADKGYLEQMQDFVTNMKTGKSPGVTVLDGARATIGALKMIEAARNETPCEINLAEILDV